MRARYGLKGINDERHICAVCGRTELKRVMWLVELDQDGGEVGEPFHVGTSCGAKLLGISDTAMNRVARSFNLWTHTQEQRAISRHPRNAEVFKMMGELEALYAERARQECHVEWNDPLNREIRAKNAQIRQANAEIIADVKVGDIGAMAI